MEVVSVPATHWHKSVTGEPNAPNELGKYGVVAFDTETTGTCVQTDKLLGLSMSDSNTSSYYFTPDSPSLPREILLDEKIPKIAHNSGFDRSIMKRHGIEINNFYDTMIAAHLCGEMGLGLKRLTYNKTLHHIKSFEDLGKKSMSELAPEEVADYSMPHALATWALWNGYWSKLSNGQDYIWNGYGKELVNNGSWGIFRDVEMPLVPILSDIELTGTLIDVESLKAMGEEFKRNINLLETAMNFHAGVNDINWNSNDQVADLLFNKLGLKGGPKTKSGKRYTVGEEYVKKLREQHPVIPLLLEYRHYQKLISTYVEGILERLIDGRIYTEFNQCGTRTGRLSSTNPNLQSIPARRPEGKRIRAVFIADPGHIIVSVDYSQIELRLIAHFSKDPALMAAYLNNLDVHLQTAMEIFGDPAMRFYGKTINFSVVYGGGARQLAEQAGVKVHVARRWLDKYWAMHKGLAEWEEHTKYFCASEQAAWTIMGRRRNLPDFQEPEKYQHAGREAISTIVQGSAAEVCKIGMKKLYDQIKNSDVKTLLQVHDEVVLSVPKNMLDDVIYTALHTMPVRKNSDDLPLNKMLSLDLPVDIKVGLNWRDTVEIDKTRYS